MAVADANHNSIELINEVTGEFHPKAEQVLKEIFKRFDKDADNVLNEEELQEFAVATNGRKFDSSVLEEITECFDVNDKNQLTFNGFYQMYHVQTLSDPEETMNDFIKHGYDHKLELVTTRTKDEQPNPPAQDDDASNDE